MLIEEQIKKLQRVKAKIDLFRKIQTNVQNELASASSDQEHKALEAQFPGLFAEFCAELDSFCTHRAETMGNGGMEPQPQRVVAEAPTPAPAAPSPPPQDPNQEPIDPLKFLLKYRGLDGKRVSFSSKDGKVEGTVRGLVTPFIKVETDSGFVVDVPPRELKVI